MEFKEVKIVEANEKSVQEIEGALLKKHEQQFSDVSDDSVKEDTPQVDVPVIDTPEKQGINEEDIISFMKERYGREISSIEELNQVREETQELPEDVAAYYKYKQETGRSLEDFVALNKDFDNNNPDKILRDYLVATEKGLDEDDINDMMEDYSYDEDLDDETTIRKAKLFKKKAIAKAKDYFESEKEKYRVPLESSGGSISSEDKKALEDYKQYVDEANTYEEEAKRKSDWFTTKTDEVFGSEFKGFEFAIDEDKKVSFTPGDSSELKSLHSSPQNFIKKFLNEDGLLTDAVGYHRALAVAMNPEKFAKHFYEQGKAEGTDDLMRKTKNVNMSDRNTPEVSSKGGTQFRAVNPDSGKGLKIRSKK